MFDFNGDFPKEKVAMMNGVTLAFIGDAVYSLYVRSMIVCDGELKTGDLNKKSSDIVRASSQARAAERLAAEFTEEEAEIFRRARNAKKGTRAKHASVKEYNESTGIEAVIGYLYLTGKSERLKYLLERSVTESL